jgi:predicted NUDIX family NTP pyrophosphohydrolase
MKKLSVVFFVHRNRNGEIKILLPRYSNKFKNARNGYGGKCERKDDGEIETFLECAIRETRQEVGLSLKEDKFLNFGKIFNGGNEVEIFVVNCKFEINFSDRKILIRADGELEDPKWFSLSKFKNWANQVFEGDEVFFSELRKSLEIFFETGDIEKIKIVKSENKELKERLKMS